MKRLLLLSLVLGILAMSCEQGIPGPPGRDGLDGLDGVNGEESFVFEYEFNFVAPDYSVLLELPSNFNMLDSDVMLVFLLWEITEDNVEIWRALPETLYLNDGILEYNYDFTKFDAELYLDGTVNFDRLGADLTDNWIARVVVIPGQFNGRTSIDIHDYNQLKEYYNLSPSKLATNKYTKRPN